MKVPAVCHPEYMPSGELVLNDPDGNIVLVEHWSSIEHDAWLAKLKGKDISP